MNKKIKIGLMLVSLVIAVSLILFKMPTTEANQIVKNKCCELQKCENNIESTGNCGCKEGNVCSAGCIQSSS